jgi:hypothetical protein
MHQTNSKWRTFGRKFMGKRVQHNEAACWIKNQYQRIPGMEWSPVCEKDITESLRAILSWKASGRDQIPNFWL